MKFDFQPIEDEAVQFDFQPIEEETSTFTEGSSTISASDLARRVPAGIAESTADAAAGVLKAASDVAESFKPVVLKGKSFSPENAAEYQALETELIDLRDEQARMSEGGGGLPDPREGAIRERMRQLEQDPLAKRPLEGAIEFTREVSEASKPSYGVDPARDQQFVSQVASGVGSIVPALASGPAAPVTIAGMMAEGGRKDAEASGATEQQQDVAFYANAGVGALSEFLLGVPALMRSARAAKIPEATFRAMAGSAAKQALLSAPREGAQEGIEQFAQNIIASDIAGYDPNREATKDVVRSIAVGAVIGPVVGGPVQVATDVDAMRAAKTRLEDAAMPETAKVLETLGQNGSGTETPDAEADAEPDATEQAPEAAIPEPVQSAPESEATPIEQPSPEPTVAPEPELPAVLQEPVPNIDAQPEVEQGAPAEAIDFQPDEETPAATLETPESAQVAPAEQVESDNQGAPTPSAVQPEEIASDNTPLAPAPPEQSPTGIRNAIVDEERVKRGLPPRMAPLRRSFGRIWDEAIARVDADPQAGSNLVAEITENPRPLEDWESALLAHEQATREQTADRLAEEMDAAPDEASRLDAVEKFNRATEAAQAVYDAGQRVGTKSGQSLAARKLLINRDFSLARMVAETRAAVNKGAPLDAKQMADVKALHDKIAAAEKRIAELEEREANTAAQDAFAALIKDLNNQAKAQAKEGKKLTDFLDDQAAKARARIKARRGKLMATIDPLNVAGLIDETIIGASYIAKGVRTLSEWSSRMINDLGEYIRPALPALFTQSQEYHDANAKVFAPKNAKPSAPTTPAEILANVKAGQGLDPKLVFDLARAHVRAGVQGMENVMQAVHKDLAPLFEGLTVREVRDAFSGYGKVTYPSKADDLAKLREYRALARLTSQLEDALKKIPPKRTGPQRDKPTEKVRELQKRVADAMKRLGIKSTAPDQQLKTSLDAIKTRLRNEIEELDAAIKNRQPRPSNKSAVEYDAEAKALKAARDAKRKEYDQIFDDTKHREQQALDAAIASAKRSIARYDEMLRTGNLKESLTGSTLTPNSELEDAQMLRDAMRAAVEELRRAEFPRKSDEQKAAERTIRALEKSIRDLDARMLAGQFAPRGRLNNRPEPKEIADLRALRDGMREAFNEMRKAQLPKRSPEEVQLARDKAALESRIKKLQEKVANNDYSEPVKRDPVTDAEKTRLQFEYVKAKEAYTRGLFEARLKQRSTGKKIWDTGLEILNTSRALMTSFDLSGVLRQGGFIAFAHPVRAAKSVPAMFRAFASEQAQFAINQEIKNRPNAPLYASSKLFIADIGEVTLTSMEEAYMSRWANKIPIVAGSGRAYATFLNKLRADSFDAMAATLAKNGTPTKEEAAAIANFVNVATGRGTVPGQAAQAAAGLNVVFFAPRYVLSRFQLIFGQPLYGGTMRTRRLVAQEYGRYLIGAGLVYALAMAAQDDDDPAIELDPRSTNFLKVRFGNTRVDPLSGLLQVTVLTSRVATGTTKNTKGKIVPIYGDKVKYGQDDATTVIGRFLRTKLSPAFGAVFNLASGKNVVGQNITPAEQAKDLVIPISFGEILETMQAHDLPKGTALSVLAIFGLGVQTYEERKKEPTSAK